MEKDPVIKSTPFRFAAVAGALWSAFQVAMMLYSANLTPQTVGINVAPVLLLSYGAFRVNRAAVFGLALYGALRLWMAIPVVAQLIENSSVMPKHWWIALVAIPFSCLWLAAGYQARSLVSR